MDIVYLSCPRKNGEEEEKGKGQFQGTPVSGSCVERFLWLLGRKSGWENHGGSKVAVEAVLWDSAGLSKGRSGWVGKQLDVACTGGSHGTRWQT